jgi:hypothetical protein
MRRSSIESGKALTDELTAVACAATGMTAEAILAIVRPIARYLDKEYGGQKIYKKSGKLDEAMVASIQRDLAMKIPKRVICRIHGITPPKLYRVLSGDD